jgi:molybdenum transport protein
MSDYMSLRLADADIERFLADDCPYGDLTSVLLEIGSQPGRIVFAARGEGVACCTEEAARLFERLGCAAEVARPTGAAIGRGTMLLEARGPAGALHTGWKTALNLLEAACGIATRTRALVDDARSVSPDIEVVATRKIFPGTKPLATKAVYAGGALPHRLGLSESVLVFVQHVAFLGGEEELLRRVPGLRARAKEKKIGVEVTSGPAALRAAEAGADIIQVDKLSPEELAPLVKTCRMLAPQAVLAAAGGITLENVKAYAATGVDLLVTSAMYWGKPADIGVTMEPTASRA